jgi:cyclic pyranopterin phosphate synthase
MFTEGVAHGMATEWTHFDAAGRPRMVDVTDKPVTDRVARAEARVRMARSTRQLIEDGKMKKGDVLAVAQLAGIMGAKRTADLIPLCHPLPLTGANVECEWVDVPSDSEAVLRITVSVRTAYHTGVEMEALTACAAAALTVYDMCKAVDKGMVIEAVRLLYKSGGRSGEFRGE